MANIWLCKHENLDAMRGAATTASAVLNCEGALPKLLELLARTSDAEKLNSSLLAASAQVTLTQVPSLDEINEVIDKVSTQALNSLDCTPPALHHATISPELMCTNVMIVVHNQRILWFLTVMYIRSSSAFLLHVIYDSSKPQFSQCCVRLRHCNMIELHITSPWVHAELMCYCFALQARSESSVLTQQVAVRIMGNWAEASVINCGKIATMQGGQALTQVAAAAASAGHNRQLEYELVRTMALLARDCPLTQSLGIDTWLRQLLYIAADAAAMKHWKLASQVAFCHAQGVLLI